MIVHVKEYSNAILPTISYGFDGVYVNDVKMAAELLCKLFFAFGTPFPPIFHIETSESGPVSSLVIAQIDIC